MKFNICLSRKAKDPEEKRNRTLAKSKNPRELLPLLTSDLDIKEKWKIISMAFEKNSTRNPDMQWLETQLEQGGEYTMVQGMRFIKYFIDPKTTDMPDWCQKIVEMDIHGRRIVQREIYVQEERRALQKQLELTPSNKTDTTARLADLEEETTQLNEEFWTSHRRLWNLKSNISPSPLHQALTTTRKNPDWHLIPWLRADCAGRGGCCQRSCGCCEQPRRTSRAFWDRGHCTTGCGCCIRTRGPTGEVKMSDLDDFPFDLINGKNLYSMRVFMAYIFGVGMEDFHPDLANATLA